MQLTGLLDLFRGHPAYNALLASLREPPPSVLSLGALRSARPFILAALARDWPAPVIYITARVDRAYNVSEQLPVWLGENAPIHRFAEPTPLFYERAPWGDTVISNRLETLAALMPPEESSISDNPYPNSSPAAPLTGRGALHPFPLRGKGPGDEGERDQGLRVHPLVVTSARAVMQPTLPVNQFRQASMSLQIGQRFAIHKLLERWLKMGYEPVPMVFEPGTFSHRGGIVDIFPVAMDRPVRVEFFDDEVDSVRHFDPSTQRSTDKIGRVAITPAREALPEHTPPIAAHLMEHPGIDSRHDKRDDTLPDSSQKSGNHSPLPEFGEGSGVGSEWLASDLQSLSVGAPFPYLEFYLPYLYPNPVSLLDYAPTDSLIVIEDWDELRDTMGAIEEAATEMRADKLAAGEIAPDHPLPYIPWSGLQTILQGRPVLSLGGNFSPLPMFGEGAGVGFSPERRFGGQLRALLTELHALRDSGERSVVVTTQAARLTDLWHEQESAFFPKTAAITEPPPVRSMLFVEGAMQEGWRLRLPGGGDLCLFTDAEIFGWSRPEPRRRKSEKRTRAPEAGYADWREGDFVVHVDYGIGRFGGMRRRTLETVEREYLVVEYAGTDTLFVPIHQADRLTRYIGPDDKPPTLNKLGQQDWIRIRSKAQKAVEEEARDLLALYAARISTPGHAFGGDTPWQHELEASFPYVETDDQLRAVREVKADMERPAPMDRLICGDVGYGKTEVALRAAFKAVMDGKQVAILVPTTILAQQHYETFSRRLLAFPVMIEMLSRFRTRDEMSHILSKLASGEVDIIIGTHRLLSEDVTIKNLGLVIIDEEQRFGVKHKEHFKKLRTQVDVLTLTATPIPRTMYMGLTGVRDISMIQTPPEERLPIITQVSMFDERLVRQAVLREMERGGQVFFVHNRVQTIDAARERLEHVVPEARLVIAHGQMDGRLLESVMEQFDRDEYDILLSTSIIESGLDIPNANTLIVDRADWFGLAQLYQLRGRVGRSSQQAYAYFFHPAANRLTEEARARLETLAEYTELGSGYQIAMRDLELRGAGDILSTRQTGHVAAIGLHLYTQLMAETVRRLKGSDTDSRGGSRTAPTEASSASDKGVLIDLPLPAYLPTDWIPEIALRLQIYRRIGGLGTLDEVDAMRSELRDRFGLLPAAVEGLLYQIDVKLLAQAAGATAVLGHAHDPNAIGAIRRLTPSENRLNIEIKLPYLVELDRRRLELTLGSDVKVTRTAVEVHAEIETWQLRLLDVLRALAEGTRIAAGM